MSVPTLDNPVWKELILGKKIVSFNFMASKLLLSRAIMEVRNNSDLIEKYETELYNFFLKNSHLPTVQKDIDLIKSEVS